MIIKLIVFISVLIILIGCFPNNNSEDQLESGNSSADKSLSTISEENDDHNLEISPIFEVASYTMIGEKGRIGFIYDDEDTRFKPNQEQKYMWHFWGEPEELEGEFKVIGKNIDTGEEVTVFETENLGGPNNGADAHIPSSMSLPSSGVWKLTAFVGGELFGTVVIECRE
ncbi:hypothetical protein GMD78_05655 [Ornithinibacillus sp. L9]|uniref:DUF4871 domain-containing protein n=1 Tax=Ornithinibacillus caprae TaxID=2678566 RepID=A0A6N8FED5_9BACI|nr:hypothetical protein [Ornithinibacillus caprae]MUK87883.1 hypothetical protein [Ornithinibacillus caprae]